MFCNPIRSLITVARARRALAALFITSALMSACGVRPGGTGTVGALTATQEIETQPNGTAPPPPSVTVAGPAQVVDNEALAYCFAFPEGFTQQAYGSQVEVVGPHVATDPHPGLLWVEATDARGRTPQDVALEEMAAFGAPVPRSTIVLAGEEVPVLDGMPGQDPIRKVYIVHDGLLYTLNFSPDSLDNATAKAQMEALFASVTSSWVWKPSGTPCPISNSSRPPAGGAHRWALIHTCYDMFTHCYCTKLSSKGEKLS